MYNEKNEREREREIERERENERERVCFGGPRSISLMGPIFELSYFLRLLLLFVSSLSTFFGLRVKREREPGNFLTQFLLIFPPLLLLFLKRQLFSEVFEVNLSRGKRHRDVFFLPWMQFRQWERGLLWREAQKRTTHSVQTAVFDWRCVHWRGRNVR